MDLKKKRRSYIAVQISEEIKKRLRKIAKENGVTVNYLLGTWIREKLRDRDNHVDEFI